MIKQTTIITYNDADTIVAMGQKYLRTATVRTPTGRQQRPAYRNCFTAKLSEQEIVAPVWHRLVDSITSVTDTNKNQLESIELVLYAPGGFYGIHNDNPTPGSPADAIFQESGGSRIISGVVGLVNPSNYKGGDLVFENTNPKKIIRPDRAGSFIYWRNKEFDSAHRASVVESGLKWVLVVFIREYEYVPEKDLPYYEGT